MIHAHGGVRERNDKMTKKNYTKYSDNSKETENKEIEELDVNSMTDEEKAARIETVLEIRSSEGVDEELYNTLTEELTTLGYVEPIVEPEVETQNDSAEHTGETEMEPEVGPEVEPTVEPEEIDEIEGIVLPKRLNVRKEASKDSDVVCVVTKDTSLVVILTESTEDFYKVRTLDTEGFCMKEFIELR